MKQANFQSLPILFLVLFVVRGDAQNVGIGATIPEGKLHINGSENIPQLIIDADSTQDNNNPFIKLRKRDGTDLMWIHSDDLSNVFVGVNAGNSNVVDTTGIQNTFIGGGAGYANASGSNNTSLGSSALLFNTSAGQNTAIGVSALRSQSL